MEEKPLEFNVTTEKEGKEKVYQLRAATEVTDPPCTRRRPTSMRCIRRGGGLACTMGACIMAALMPCGWPPAGRGGPMVLGPHRRCRRCTGAGAAWGGGGGNGGSSRSISLRRYSIPPRPSRNNA